ncbi:MAG: hypothetical protein ACOYLN_04120 [Blastocatellia bacterium]
MNCQSTREAIDSGIVRKMSSTVGKSEATRNSLMSHIDSCTDCSGYSSELDSLLSLLKAQPRVEVPSDFDFKLRASIARAKSEQREATSSPIGSINPIEWLSRLWAGSLSKVQTSAAMAAMAAVALVVSVSTYQINQRSYSPVNSASGGQQVGTFQAGGAQIASIASGNKVAESAISTTSNGSTVSSETNAMAATVAKLNASRAFESRQSVRAGSVNIAAAGETDAVASQPDGNANSWRVFNHEQGRMVSTTSQLTLIGAESSAPVGPAGSVGQVAGYVPSI